MVSSNQIILFDMRLVYASFRIERILLPLMRTKPLDRMLVEQCALVLAGIKTANLFRYTFPGKFGRGRLPFLGACVYCRLPPRHDTIERYHINAKEASPWSSAV